MPVKAGILQYLSKINSIVLLLMNRILACVTGLCLSASAAFSQETVRQDWGILKMPGKLDTSTVVSTWQIYAEGLDTLPHMVYWRKVITLPPDSGVLSIGSNRQMLATMACKDWDKKTDPEKEMYRDSVRRQHGLTDSTSIFFATGKNDFFNIPLSVPEVDRGVRAFAREGVDPFYAQAILLIESPGKVRKSHVGAYGSFQLMPAVARKMGLKVTKTVDERADFDKSAKAAAKLLSTVCIPYTNAMLEKRGIAYKPTDLWYRLLVMHVYHAGAGNVEKALATFEPCEGNIEIIKTLWHTKAGQFGKASQNYSQVAVAALLEMDAYLKSKSEP